MATEAEKAWQKRYRSSEKGRATIERYKRSEVGQAKLKKYRQSEGRRAAQARYDVARRQDRINKFFLRSYGLTVEERDALFIAQGSSCAACGAVNPGSKKGWMVDHCHTTNKVRGILCHHCNLALGNVKDSTQRLTKLIAYLRVHG